VLAWSHWEGTFSSTWGSIYNGTAWEAPTALENSTQKTGAPHAAFSLNGDAVVAWPQYDGTNWNIWANIYK